MTSAAGGPMVSAPSFIIDFTGSPMGRMAFSELQGINSKVNSTEYIYSDDKGDIQHTKQFGKTEPPTITLKRALDADGNNKLMAWHEMARTGAPSARLDGSLTVLDPSGTAKITYALHGAWCTELTISGMKAGSSDVAMIECKITCERIVAGT